MRWLMPHPCNGASDNALRTSRSSVPCNTSDDAILPLLSNAQGREYGASVECARKRRFDSGQADDDVMANVAPCGSAQRAIHEPPGTSCGSRTTFPPSALTFSAA